MSLIPLAGALRKFGSLNLLEGAHHISSYTCLPGLGLIYPRSHFALDAAYSTARQFRTDSLAPRTRFAPIHPMGGKKKGASQAPDLAPQVSGKTSPALPVAASAAPTSSASGAAPAGAASSTDKTSPRLAGLNAAAAAVAAVAAQRPAGEQTSLLSPTPFPAAGAASSAAAAASGSSKVVASTSPFGARQSPALSNADSEEGCPHHAATSSSDCGHDECRTEDEVKSLSARHTLIKVSIFCFAFMCAEIVGGYLANSLAIMTDAAHLLSDLASFLVSIMALVVSQKAPTSALSFGFHRAEILGAVVSVLIIWLLTGTLPDTDLSVRSILPLVLSISLTFSLFPLPPLTLSLRRVAVRGLWPHHEP